MEVAQDQKAGAGGVADLVLNIVAEMAPSGETDVKPETELVNELGFDSLGLLELVAVLEDALKVPDVDIERLDRVEQVGDLQRLFEQAHDQTGVRKPL